MKEYKNSISIKSPKTGLLITAILLAQFGFSQTKPEEFKGVIGKTLADSKEYWPEPVTAPKGAPNVVWIILDDVGYGATSAFGGLIETPVLESLANNGLRYTNFHTTAICAPTRSALLTGSNSHKVHVGGFSHTIMSAGFPGWDGRLPSKNGTVAEILRDKGYNTFGVGKYGITPDEEATDAGPFDRWPTGKGFEHFFGFLGSATDQYKPDLIEDQAHVTPDGRHLSEQITDKAISYIARQQKAAPGKPFFLYYSPAAVHAPHQVAQKWSDPYKGKFDDGWDAYREKTIANQKKLGVIPSNAVLPERNPLIADWKKLTPDQKKVYSKFMEVYAGYLTYTDYEIGRLVNYLKEINQLENTVVFVLIGDNGASKEGTLQGAVNRQTYVVGETDETVFQNNLKRIGEIGTPETYTNYPLGWAQATNVPFKDWKQDANSEGGTHNPLIVYYPKGIKTPGIRTQYSHVIDILPTTLDILGVKAPESIREIKQDTIQGYSFYNSLNDAKAVSNHKIQHYYIFGARAIYSDGWKAAAAHHPNSIEAKEALSDPKKAGLLKADFDKDVWELYNINEDFNEQKDLAKKYPEKLAELKKLFDEQAKKNNLYPLIDWSDVYLRKIHKTPATEGKSAQELLTKANK
ncbi:arylsulfatase [Flavobacterium cutihirudinis]|uniref:Arylsulfatase n=1 Tax=Flavobacterium cutihirudinis TaxID=1265740 RepID=A0A3D9FSH6_9FLAO|nr:arylsulfatase [Flavobacterium cutihirudinis]RED23506.1 arylsulfatase [Flavobacterium cutihirudinis]